MLLKGVGRRPNHHPGIGLGGARRDWVSRSLDLDHAESATSKRLQPGIVAKGGDRSFQSRRNLIERLALRVGDKFAVESDLVDGMVHHERGVV